MWYLARAETQSHVAVFTIEARDDARGVNTQLQDVNSLGSAQSYALKKIALYTRDGYAANTPVKTTFFDYNYSLCPGIDNSINGGGKLTLKKYGLNTEAVTVADLIHMFLSTTTKRQTVLLMT